MVVQTMVLVWSSLAPVILAETPARLPPLNITEWILGEPADFGGWGDGRVYLVDFWGTWCSPCIAGMPALTALHEKYADRGFAVIGYSWEADVEHLRAFVAKQGERMGYLAVNDTEEKTMQALAADGYIQGFPYAFLVDRDGKVVWAGNPKGVEPVLAKFFK